MEEHFSALCKEKWINATTFTRIETLLVDVVTEGFFMLERHKWRHRCNNQLGVL